MHAPQSLDHGNKSKSMSTSFLPPINNHYRRAFLQFKSQYIDIKPPHFHFSGLPCHSFLKRRITSRGYCMHITIIGPHRTPNLLSCFRESTWQPCTAPINSKGICSITRFTFVSFMAVFLHVPCLFIHFLEDTCSADLPSLSIRGQLFLS